MRSPSSPPRPRRRSTPAITPRSSSRTRSCVACWRPPGRSRSRSSSARASRASSSSGPRALLFKVAHDEQAEDFHELAEILDDEVERLEEVAKTGNADHRHPVRVRGPRRDHRRLPARQPDHPRRPPRHGQVGPRRQHRRERRGQGASPGRLLLARDVGDGARPAPDRQAGADPLRQAAQGPGQRVATGSACSAVCNELEGAPLWIDESSDLGILDLRGKARRLHAQETRARAAAASA